MEGATIVSLNLERTINKQNNLNVIINSLKDYFSSIQLAQVSLKSISDSLNEFFCPESIFSTPSLILIDNLNKVQRVLRSHLHSFSGIDEKMSELKKRNRTLKKMSKEFKAILSKYIHYKKKLKNLKIDRHRLEVKGEVITQKQIQRIARVSTNQLK